MRILRKLRCWIRGKHDYHSEFIWIALDGLYELGACKLCASLRKSKLNYQREQKIRDNYAKIWASHKKQHMKNNEIP